MKAHLGNHFSLTIHNYIVSFSVKKTGVHLGVVCCPFLHFHQLASARLEPHVRSAGPTTGNHKGRVNIGDLHFAPGWVTGLSQPPSMRFFNRLSPKRRKWRSFLSCILQFQLLNQWFFLLCQCHLCPGPSGRATHWIKLGYKSTIGKSQCICEAPFPKCSNFFSLKNSILYGKIFWLKIRLDVDKRSISVDVSVYWTTFFKTY